VPDEQGGKRGAQGIPHPRKSRAGLTQGLPGHSPMALAPQQGPGQCRQGKEEDGQQGPGRAAIG